MSLRMKIRAAGLALVHRFGMRIVDHESGRLLGRALLIPWRGQIHLIGLEATVRPAFLPQKRLTFWKQALGFTTHPPPDFPSTAERDTAATRRDDRRRIEDAGADPAATE